ncbi:ABC transporter substrate-binding protein [Streptomyces sp. NPDC091292]|uniref:ABC transporter substrate-binding protein n=1 Tax=Streptomyces sp. NPDC091292 TaxID=3365991 RepID=UPI00380351D9
MRRLRTWAGTALLALGVSACGSGGGGPSAPADSGKPVKVTVGLLSVAAVAPAYLGDDRGFFRDEGLDVAFRPVQGGAEAVPMLMSNEIQFSFGNAISMAYAQLQGIGTQFVTEGAQGGTGPKDATTGIVVSGKSGIKSAGDLAGKTFGVNQLKALGEITIRTALEKRGVDTSQLKFVEIDFPEMNAALANGSIDAAYSTEPFMSQALAAGNRTVLDAVAETAPHLSLSGYFTSQQYAEKNKDVVARFQRAMNRSLDYAASHPDEVRTVIPQHTKVPAAVAKRMKLPHWTSELNVDSIRLLIRQGRAYGLFKKDVDVDALLGSAARTGSE